MALSLSACGGRADRDESFAGQSGGVGASGGAVVTGGSSGDSSGGRGGSGEGGSRAGASGTAGTSSSGGASGSGGAGNNGGTRGGSAGASGQGGAGGSSNPPDVGNLVGDYDVLVSEPPALEGCTPDWYEPRLNLSISENMGGELYIDAFADFQWSMYPNREPPLLHLPELLIVPPAWNNVDALGAPGLTLQRDSEGLTGYGTAEISYSCTDGSTTALMVGVTVLPDTTPPKLRMEPFWWDSVFAFTTFGFRFSEPVVLPSGDYLAWFEKPEDGAAVAELVDQDTGEAFATKWQWSLAGPIATANLIDLDLVETHVVLLRVLQAVTDRAGNPVVAIQQGSYIQPAAPLGAEIDFDDGPVIGLQGNATYHAQAEPGAPCEQGGCLVLDGPVPICGVEGPPASMFAVRIDYPWDYWLDIRYRVWSDAQFVSPIQVAFGSGCLGEYNANLSLLPEADGIFTRAGPWIDDQIGPCGGPDHENGFVIALGCAEGPEVPNVRVVIERIARAAP